MKFVFISFHSRSREMLDAPVAVHLWDRFIQTCV